MTVRMSTSTSSISGSGSFRLTLCPLVTNSGEVSRAATMVLRSFDRPLIFLNPAMSLIGTADHSSFSVGSLVTVPPVCVSQQHAHPTLLASS